MRKIGIDYIYNEANTRRDKLENSSFKIPEGYIELMPFYFGSRGHEVRIFVKSLQGLIEWNEYLKHQYDDRGGGDYHYYYKHEFYPFTEVKEKERVIELVVNPDWRLGADRLKSQLIGKQGRYVKVLQNFFGKKVIIK